MTTALEIIESAMGKINMLAAGETVSAEDAALCLSRLNSLVDAWGLENLMAYTTTETIFTLPANTTSRTIGAAQQIAVARPVRIELGSFTRLSGIDRPLEPTGEVDYNSIALKSSQSGWPSKCHFDGGSPTGNVFFWPPASEAVEVHLITLYALSQFADTATDYTLPTGYKRALEFNLSVEVAPDFRAQVSPYVAGAASNSKRLIKRMNHTVPQLDMPRNMGGARGSPSPADFYGGY
jgi:hypothetical protein